MRPGWSSWCSWDDRVVGIQGDNPLEGVSHTRVAIIWHRAVCGSWGVRGERVVAGGASIPTSHTFTPAGVSPESHPPRAPHGTRNPHRGAARHTRAPCGVTSTLITAQGMQGAADREAVWPGKGWGDWRPGRPQGGVARSSAKHGVGGSPSGCGSPSRGWRSSSRKRGRGSRSSGGQGPLHMVVVTQRPAGTGCSVCWVPGRPGVRARAQRSEEDRGGAPTSSCGSAAERSSKDVALPWRGTHGGRRVSRTPSLGGGGGPEVALYPGAGSTHSWREKSGIPEGRGVA